MKSKHILVMAGVVAIGLSGLKVMAMGADTTNKYLNTTSPAGSCRATLTGSGTVERSVLIESSSSSPAMIEKTVSTPVVIERAHAGSVLIEDRIVKQKHMFGLGIWPVFNFEIL